MSDYKVNIYIFYTALTLSIIVALQLYTMIGQSVYSKSEELFEKRNALRSSLAHYNIDMVDKKLQIIAEKQKQSIAYKKLIAATKQA